MKSQKKSKADIILRNFGKNKIPHRIEETAETFTSKIEYFLRNFCAP